MDNEALSLLMANWDRMYDVRENVDIPAWSRTAAAEDLVDIGHRLVEEFIKPRLELVCGYCGGTVVMSPTGYVHETSATRTAMYTGMPESLRAHNIAGTAVGAYDVVSLESFWRNEPGNYDSWLASREA